MAFRGITAPLPVGLLGLHGSKNQSQLTAAHFSYSEGVDIDGGLIRKDGGVLALNDTALPADVISGTSWSPEIDTYHDVIMLNSGQVRRDTGDGTFATVMRTGLNVSLEPPPYFCPAGGETVGAPRKLFMVSASNQMQVIAGTAASMAAISTPAADWSAAGYPTFAVQHGNRMWAGGNASDPHRIYYSMLTNHESYTGTGSGTIAIYPGEGERLVGGISFSGLLILWKYPLGVYLVDTRDPVIANWSVVKVSTSVGGVNQQTILSVNSDVMYLDHTGSIHLLSATNATGDITTSNLLQLVQINKFMMDNISLARIRRSCAVWYPLRQAAWFFLPQKGSFENDLRLVVDKSDPNVGVRFLTDRRDSANTAWMRPDEDRVPRPVIGEGPLVQQMDQLARNKNGVAYTMEFETANTDFGYLDDNLRFKNKSGAFLEIVSDLETRATFEIQVYWDEVLHDTIIFDIGSDGAALDAFVLDTDRLAAAGTKTLRRRLPGSGKRLRLRFKNEGLDEDVGMSAFFVSFGLMDESTGR
jgi:hypothetical protein